MNIQTLPRSDVLVKKAFVPKLDWFLFADYDQIELRILAYYLAGIGDYSMAQVLSNPEGDLHSESAKAIFRLNREPTSEERSLGKSLNFSMVYGGGRPAVLRYLKEFYKDKEIVPDWSYAGEVLDNFHARWPGLKALQEMIHKVYQKRGWLETIAGARIHPVSQNKELNELVQSSAAEFMRFALLEVCEELEKRDYQSHPVCVVHDELILDVYEPELLELIRGLPDWMVRSFPKVLEVLPILVSLKVSNESWADAKAIT
ncbi:MAG: DNA polymerase [Halobacteria archaeon]